MTSFFGGDPSVSHFTVSEHYRLPSERMGQPEYGKDGARRREQRAILKSLGFKKPYFQYRNKDATGKAAAKKKAEAFAKKWSAKSGFELEVAEGCFLLGRDKPGSATPAISV